MHETLLAEKLDAFQAAVASVDGLKLSTAPTRTQFHQLTVTFPTGRQVVFVVSPRDVRYRNPLLSPRSPYVILRNPAKYRANLLKLVAQFQMVADHQKGVVAHQAMVDASSRAAVAQRSDFSLALLRGGITNNDWRTVGFTGGSTREADGCYFLSRGAETQVYGFALRYKSEAVKAEFTVATADEAIAKIRAMDLAFPAVTVDPNSVRFA